MSKFKEQPARRLETWLLIVSVAEHFYVAMYLTNSYSREQSLDRPIGWSAPTHTSDAFPER